MLAVRLPEDIEERLEKLAKKTGRAKSFYVREALSAYLANPGGLLPRRDAHEVVQRGQDPPKILVSIIRIGHRSTVYKGWAMPVATAAFSLPSCGSGDAV